MPPWNASSDAMLTILPRPRAEHLPARRPAEQKTAVRLTSMTASQSSSVNSTAGARRMMPALLTRMSMPPSAAAAFVHQLRRDRAVARSPATTAAVRPSASIRAAVSVGACRLP